MFRLLRPLGFAVPVFLSIPPFPLVLCVEGLDFGCGSAIASIHGESCCCF